MKAILDEEARWAREEEEAAADPEKADSAQTSQIPDVSKAIQEKAQAAYFITQSYPGYETPMVDIRK